MQNADGRVRTPDRLIGVRGRPPLRDKTPQGWGTLIGGIRGLGTWRDRPLISLTGSHSPLDLDNAKDLTHGNRCHDRCKDKNPRDVALLD